MPINNKHINLIKISAGDEEAFQLLFETYYSKLYHFLLTFVKQEIIAEELCLDIFTKIWMGKTLLNEVQNIEAFLYKIAKNKAIDYLRMVANKPQFIHDTYLKMQEMSDGISSDYLVRSKEMESLFLAACDLLSPQRKKIFILSRIEGKSQQEIATLLNISKATVNNQITEAKKTIRKFLSNNMEIITVLITLNMKH